jgi:hypothetical protein
LSHRYGPHHRHHQPLPGQSDCQSDPAAAPPETDRPVGDFTAGLYPLRTEAKVR